MSDLDNQCRLCGRYLIGTLKDFPGWPKPLLPGDIPARSQVCDFCAITAGPFPDQPYTAPWAT